MYEKNLQDELTITERLLAPTPKLFGKIRNIGIIAAAIAGALLGIKAQGITLPAYLDLLASISGVVGGLIASCVGQLAVDFPAYKIQQVLKSIG